ncbi:MAG: hypothetical protein LBT18_03790 [Endomicrobium sp.]|jgi:hypothetical protein|nr:hypothetical protein [Endomicrobium sp.]
MEFKLIMPKEADFLEQSSKAITFNKAEIEEYVKGRVAKYEGRFYEDEQIKEAKLQEATPQDVRQEDVDGNPIEPNAKGAVEDEFFGK